MALLPSPMQQPKQNAPSFNLPAPEKSSNKNIYPVQPVGQPEYTTQPYYGGNPVGGLMSKSNQINQVSSAGAPDAKSTAMPPKPTDGANGTSTPTGQAGTTSTTGTPQAKTAAPSAAPTMNGGVPQSSFTPGDLDTGDYTGVQSDKELQYDPRDESLVQNQITGLLDPNSDLMRKAISQSQGYAAQRGLQSSSIGGEMALSAMVDKALPIAQQDAQTHNQAQSQQWTEQAKIDADNLAREHAAAMADKEGTIQNSLQNNQLGWQTGEKNTDREFQAKLEDLKYQQQLGTLDKQQELQLAQMEKSSQLQNDRDAILQTYQVELNQLQNDQRWKELSAQIGAQFEQQARGFDQQTKLEYGNAQATAINAAMQAIGMAMSNPNMTSQQQQEAVKQIMGSLQSQATQLSIIYGASSSGGTNPPGPATGVQDPRPPQIDNPYPGGSTGGSTGGNTGGSRPSPGGPGGDRYEQVMK